MGWVLEVVVVVDISWWRVSFGGGVSLERASELAVRVWGRRWSRAEGVWVSWMWLHKSTRIVESGIANGEGDVVRQSGGLTVGDSRLGVSVAWSTQGTRYSCFYVSQDNRQVTLTSRDSVLLYGACSALAGVGPETDPS